MKILKLALVLYSFILSLLMTVFLIYALSKMFIINLSTVVQIILCIIGIISFILYLFKKQILSFVLITIWWVPQTFYIWQRDMKTFKALTYNDIIYDSVMIFRLNLSHGVGNDLSKMTEYNINVLAIAGMILSYIILKKLENSNEITISNVEDKNLSQ